jgi:hypothetical protein
MMASSCACSICNHLNKLLEGLDMSMAFGSTAPGQNAKNSE